MFMPSGCAAQGPTWNHPQWQHRVPQTASAPALGQVRPGLGEGAPCRRLSCRCLIWHDAVLLVGLPALSCLLARGSARGSARRTFFGYSSAQNYLVHLDASAASHSVPWPSGHGRASAGAPSCRPSSAKARGAGGRAGAAAATGREGMRAGSRELKRPACVQADKTQAQGSALALTGHKTAGRSATSTYGASGGNQALWLVAVHLR